MEPRTLSGGEEPKRGKDRDTWRIAHRRGWLSLGGERGCRDRDKPTEAVVVGAQEHR